jgi:sterol desaturase/sphingolipid hydroxylase (fatty acid hydroxylase superfamily)
VHHFIQAFQPYCIAVVFLLAYAAEHIFPQRTDFADIKHDLKNICIGLLNAVIIFIAGIYFQEFISYLNHIHFGMMNRISLPFYLQLILQVFLIDLFMYWWHRSNHMLPFLWRFHQFHHRDKKLNTTSALRFHLMELSLSYVARLLVFPLLGISISAILVYSVIFFPVVILHHSNISISESIDLFIRKMVVSPRMHRIHHSRIVQETNSNYGSVFPWWDSIFNSYRKQPLKEIDFGLNELDAEDKVKTS